VFPIVTEVVHVQRRQRVVLPVVEVIGHTDPPAWNERTLTGLFVDRDADLLDLVLGVKNPELVEMIFQPAHGILNGDMESPE
jgi:hypothetical protein